MYDTIIIGGGIAGLTAAIYSSRRNMKTLILSIDIGGQMSKINDIENWPGQDQVDGMELSKNTKTQAEKFGTEFKFEQAIKIIKDDHNFTVKTTANEYNTKTIILAYGKVPRVIGINGEDRLIGRGVSYCVNCDGPFFKQKDVVVVGGGNSALDAAVYMSQIANKVYLVHRRNQFRGEEYLVKKIEETENIELVLNDNIEQINGTDKVESVQTKNGKTLQVSAVFIEIGYVVNNTLVEGFINCDKLGQIIVDQSQETSVSGIFAAGDLTNHPFKQLVIAAGEGATAALSAYGHIQKNP